jgi:G3E family GTPase
VPCTTSSSLPAVLSLLLLLLLLLQGYGNQRFVFQGVHETICYGPSDKPWGENETRINQIVFIGRKLDRKALMEGFR